ncbi:MAG: DUF1801 domain-containing protein [Rhodobacteraceae bacterium]|nr:DUF1801 domain-containing protein [Paracoccaceae bacterium]
MNIDDANVAAAFSAFPENLRAGLLGLRARIKAVALAENIPLEEALRWGQPAYLAAKGSTIRLGTPKSGGFAIYTHCQTSLMSDFKAICPELNFEGNRAVHFAAGETPPASLEFLIRAALTYHTA